MLQEILIELYERDLNKLKTEIEQFKVENDLWKTSGEITNSAGNLCQHLLGNLQHFIGATLGDSGYIRDRDSEFASKNSSREELLKEIDTTLAVVKKTLSKLDDDDFAKTYPIEVFGTPQTTGSFLTHLTTHFNYHLGQINYHRRLVS
ncbi:MAG: DinB superfamily protein [Acidobacteria bacterium]|nr:MAG: DinB superfamily protein [Acidobacteriota bacterium]